MFRVQMPATMRMQIEFSIATPRRDGLIHGSMVTRFHVIYARYVTITNTLRYGDIAKFPEVKTNYKFAFASFFYFMFFFAPASIRSKSKDWLEIFGSMRMAAVKTIHWTLWKWLWTVDWLKWPIGQTVMVLCWWKRMQPAIVYKHVLTMNEIAPTWLQQSSKSHI